MAEMAKRNNWAVLWWLQNCDVEERTLDPHYRLLQHGSTILATHSHEETTAGLPSFHWGHRCRHIRHFRGYHLRQLIGSRSTSNPLVAAHIGDGLYLPF